MVNHYKAGATAMEVAERYGVILRSVKRLLHRRGVRRLGA